MLLVLVCPVDRRIFFTYIIIVQFAHYVNTGNFNWKDRWNELF